jgi:hypothetical protein
MSTRRRACRFLHQLIGIHGSLPLSFLGTYFCQFLHKSWLFSPCCAKRPRHLLTVGIETPYFVRQFLILFVPQAGQNDPRAFRPRRRGGPASLPPVRTVRGTISRGGPPLIRSGSPVPASWREGKFTSGAWPFMNARPAAISCPLRRDRPKSTVVLPKASGCSSEICPDLHYLAGRKTITHARRKPTNYANFVISILGSNTSLDFRSLSQVMDFPV